MRTNRLQAQGRLCGTFNGARQPRTASWAKFNRPYGTRFRDGRSHAGGQSPDFGWAFTARLKSCPDTKHQPKTSIPVRQIIGVYADIVRGWILNKPYRLNFAKSIQKSLANAVHSVHHAPVTEKNDGESKIAIKHQARMADYFAARQLPGVLICPIRLLELTDRR